MQGAHLDYLALRIRCRACMQWLHWAHVKGSLRSCNQSALVLLRRRLALVWPVIVAATAPLQSLYRLLVFRRAYLQDLAPLGVQMPAVGSVNRILAHTPFRSALESWEVLAVC